jgi:ATP-dependent Lon protease
MPKKKNKRDDDDDEDYDDPDYDDEDDEDKKIVFILKNDNNNKKKIIKKPDKKYAKILEKFFDEEIEYFNKLDTDSKNKIIESQKSIDAENIFNINEPFRFKFLLMNTTPTNKFILTNKYEQLCKMSPYSGEYVKLHNWINVASKLPLGKYKKLEIDYNNSNEEISKYLINMREKLDDEVYGHTDAKSQIIRILSQWISFPSAKGYIIGIHGSMGIGKTKLIKEGISKVLNFPFSFISLGGISDASYLTGHLYTYEGSKYGKIVECLIKTQVMNPIIFFDELDKVSDTKSGEEIINTLIHLTDSTQNEKFTDKYMEEIDLDMSKSLIFFSYNDENLINPILRDRMITIKVKGYNTEDKIKIARDYLIKDILKEYNIKNDEIVFTDDVIKFIIENTNEEEGVRNLQRNLNNIISHINMFKYIPDKNVKIDKIVSIDFCEKYCKKTCDNNYAKHSMYL